jgi:hypothetical protein
MDQFEARQSYFQFLAKKARYIGVYYHKLNPEAFGLARYNNKKRQKPMRR